MERVQINIMALGRAHSEASPVTYSNEVADPFQIRVKTWLKACFGDTVRADREERTHRFLEEAMELAQASGCTKHDVLILVDYVFSRPRGKLDQEVGGVMVTLAGLCSASGVNMHDAGDRELARNWRRIDDSRL